MVLLVKQSLMFVSSVSEDTDVIIMNHNNEEQKEQFIFAHITEIQQTTLMPSHHLPPVLNIMLCVY